MMWKLVFAITATLSISVAQKTGGFMEIPIDDEGVKSALEYAVLYHNNNSNDFYIRVVTHVIKAWGQVVAGENYVIQVKMARTYCRKYDVNPVCVPAEDPAWAQPYQCTFSVWSRIQPKDMILTRQECS
ncbi:cst6 [Pungitius sinensis]